jgi:hypothetical protein
LLPHFRRGSISWERGRHGAGGGSQTSESSSRSRLKSLQQESVSLVHWIQSIFNPSIAIAEINLTLVTKDLLFSIPASSDMLRVVTACRDKLDGAKAEHPAIRANTVDRSNMVNLCQSCLEYDTQTKWLQPLSRCRRIIPGTGTVSHHHRWCSALLTPIDHVRVKNIEI